MKKIFTLLPLAALLLFTSLTNFTCSKTDAVVKSDKELATGHWNINRIQWKVFYNGIFTRDTILKQSPKPENYVQFDANGAFKYQFNTSTPETGTYAWTGTDLIQISTTHLNFTWKKLTLISDGLFTLMRNTTSPVFPGATIEEYHTLVKPK